MYVVCNNRRDPTKERNSFDPSNFTKGERPRLEGTVQNRTHASHTVRCPSEIDVKGRRFKVLSLSLHYTRDPHQGNSHQWYSLEPVTKSESRRLRTNDIACGSRHSATIELLFARESRSVSNISGVSHSMMIPLIPAD